jgi:hypothetical protein
MWTLTAAIEMGPGTWLELAAVSIMIGIVLADVGRE